MKKLWKQYSYAITLIILSCSLAFLLSLQQESEDKYVKVTISEGDSLWEIANQYSEQHSLSHKEFVSWVKKMNKNSSDQIFPGEEIIIPVRIDNQSTTELASALGD